MNGKIQNSNFSLKTQANGKSRFSSLLLSLLIGLILVVSTACSRPVLPSPTEASGQVEGKPTPQLSNESGRLAYLGTDGNVYVTTADSSAAIAVTTDATAAPEKFGYSYNRVSWAPDGRLAYASVDRSYNSAESQLFVTDDPGNSERVVGTSDQHFVIYIHWSPISCPLRSDCSDLAYLIEEPDGIALRVVDIGADRVRNRRIGIGGPVYFSWSPGGEEILWHSGGGQRFDAQPRLALHQFEDGQTRSLGLSPGRFLAPAWSPLGDSWLAVTREGTRSLLQRFMGEQMTMLVSSEDRWLTFVWSPTGKKIAYAVSEDVNRTAYGPIHVYDLESGESQQITDRFFIAGFFWSPAGDRIAYLTRPELNGNFMQWRVFDLTENEDHGYEMFRPSYQMRYEINSFDQYAQSHRFWSPNGRYLLYADRDNLLVERVWLIDTWAPNTDGPIFIDEGTIGVWSWQ